MLVYQCECTKYKSNEDHVLFFNVSLLWRTATGDMSAVNSTPQVNQKTRVVPLPETEIVEVLTLVGILMYSPIESNSHLIIFSQFLPES